MAGSEADKQPEAEAESAPDGESAAKRPSLADFLKPAPRSKRSMPPAAEPSTVAEVPAPSSSNNLGALFSEAPIPRSRRRSSFLPPPHEAEPDEASSDASLVEETQRSDADDRREVVDD